MVEKQQTQVMKKNDKTFCIGVACPVKWTCQRYTKGIELVVTDGTLVKYIRYCTNQKKYVQDEDNINTDSKRV